MTRVLVYVMLILLASVGPAVAQGDAAHGAKVYAAQKCSICHSISGKGNAKGPLDGIAAKLSADDLRAWIVDAVGQTAKTKAPRKPPMKNYVLPKEDLDALVAYLSTLKK